MSITLHLKQVRSETLEILKNSHTQVDIFYDAEWLTKDKLASKYRDLTHLDLFLSEWETPDLDLYKDYPELTYMLAGYVPDYEKRHLALPELQARPDLMQRHNFMNFLIIENSEWDGLPLVNALWSGVGIGLDRATWYHTPEQVGEILDGLLWISHDGFRKRCEQDKELERIISWDDDNTKKTIELLIEYFAQIVDYYRCAARANHAMLADLSM